MAPNSDWTEILAVTLRAYRDKLVDNIFLSTPLFFRLKDARVRLGGGESIVARLQYGKNPNVKSYSGLDVLPMNEREIVTAVQYNWKNVAGSVVIAGDEQRKNSGEEAMINLLESRIINCEDTMIEELNRMFFSDGTGNGGKDMLGLKAIVTNTGTLAGISKTVNTWWQANYVDAPGTETWGGSSDTMYKAMRNMINRCSKGKSRQRSNLIATEQETYENYENSMSDNIRYGSSDIADAGFESVVFKKTPMVWDEDCDSGKMYFLNIGRYLYLATHTDADFTPTPLMAPYNQDAIGGHILVMGNLVCAQCRKQGALYGISN